MVIRRRLCFLLPCLSLGLILAAPLGIYAEEAPAEDFLTFWRGHSLVVPQLNPLSILNGEMPFLVLSEPVAGAQILAAPPALPPILAADPLPAASEENGRGGLLGPWETLDNRSRKVSQKSEGFLGSLSAEVEVNDAPRQRVWYDPSWKRTWQTDNSWKLDVGGPISVFGQVGANSDEAQQANMKVSGRTGLACKLPIGSLAECTFRSGPGVSYTDPLHPLRTQGRSDWLLEFQARWPLLFGIGLEYQGSALPSLTPMQQDMVNQDVRLALPLGGSGKLKLGAKRQWTGVFDQRAAWTDNTQLYLGLELNH